MGNAAGANRLGRAFGALLVGRALLRPSFGGLILGLGGATLILRGLSGYCALYQTLGTNTAKSDHARRNAFRDDLEPVDEASDESSQRAIRRPGHLSPAPRAGEALRRTGSSLRIAAAAVVPILNFSKNGALPRSESRRGQGFSRPSQPWTATRFRKSAHRRATELDIGRVCRRHVARSKPGENTRPAARLPPRQTSGRPARHSSAGTAPTGSSPAPMAARLSTHCSCCRPMTTPQSA